LFEFYPNTFTFGYCQQRKKLKLATVVLIFYYINNKTPFAYLLGQARPRPTLASLAFVYTSASICFPCLALLGPQKKTNKTAEPKQTYKSMKK
jgi:hypothetical protein